MAEELRHVDPEDLTIKGAIVLGLLAAEHVTPLLADHPAARTAIEQALQADWSWVEKDEPKPDELYWNYMEALWDEDSKLGEGHPQLPIYHCGLEAHMYAIWRAEGAEYLQDPDTELSIGSEIDDVDYSYLTRCLEQAVAVSPQPERTAEWLNGLIELIERDQRASGSDRIGTGLRRQDFTVPEVHFA